MRPSPITLDNGDIDAALAAAEPNRPDPPEPDDAQDHAIAWTPFPVDALPEPMRALVTEGAAAIGCDPSMVALPAMAAAASAIGSARAVMVKAGWIERATIWAAVVAQSGTAKSHAMMLAVDPLRDAQRRAFAEHAAREAEYAAAEKRYRTESKAWDQRDGEGPPPSEPVRPVCERLIVSDITIEAIAPILAENPRGLLVDRDELGAWLRSFGQYKAGRGGDCEAWLSIFDSSPILVDRKSAGAIYVASPHVCIAGTIQPGALARALGDEHFDNGLAARFLFAHPPGRASRFSERTVSAGTVEGWAGCLDRLRSLRPDIDDRGDAAPQIAVMSEPAKSAWVALHDELADRIDDADPRLAAALSKLRACAARLALAFHLVAEAGQRVALREPSPISAEAACGACAVARWFAKETERVYGRLAETAEQAERRRLIELIERNGGDVSARDVMRSSRMFRAAEDAEAALEELARAGLGSWAAPEQTGRGKPKGRRFVLEGR